MTSAQDIKLGINDQLRLMTQYLESLNIQESALYFDCFWFIKDRSCKKRGISKYEGK